MTQPHDDHGSSHDHSGHDHSTHADAHAPIQSSEMPSEWEILEIAVRELAIERGLFTADDHRKFLESMDAATPAQGARVVARAWVDDDFRARLLADGSVAFELGIDNYDRTNLIVVANTPTVHNLVVCTLCSCYPRPILGLPPDWYKSPSYRSRAVRYPRVLLAEFGTVLPENVSVVVRDSNADMRYLVLPLRPAGTEGWTEEALAAIVTRDAMIGVTVPRVS